MTTGIHWGGWDIWAETAPALVPRAKRWGEDGGVREGGVSEEGGVWERGGMAQPVNFCICAAVDNGMNFLYMFG